MSARSQIGASVPVEFADAVKAVATGKGQSVSTFLREVVAREIGVDVPVKASKPRIVKDADAPLPPPPPPILDY